jgi:hypothetical protein
LSVYNHTLHLTGITHNLSVYNHTLHLMG